MAKTRTDTARRFRSWATLISFALGVVALAAIVVMMPRTLVGHDLAGRTMTGPEYVKAVNDARVMVIQALGGLAVLVGAYAALRRLRLSEDELRATRDGQVTERFTRAVEQLGSPNVDVRVGAIYALERIARNSPTDRDAVIATLSAFVRRHAPWPPQLEAQPATDADPRDMANLATRANDVQSVVAVLGQLPREAHDQRIRLPGTDLRRARMWQLNLDAALLGGSSLRLARVWGSSLIGADLGDCDLRDADFTGADLTRAILWGADLRGADLGDAILTEAVYDAKTVWPVDFDAGSHALIKVNDRHELTRQRFGQRSAPER